MKLRLIQAGYTTFTGEIGHIEFKDGISTQDVMPDFARSLSGIVQTEWVQSAVAAPAVVHVQSLEQHHAPKFAAAPAIGGNAYAGGTLVSGTGTVTGFPTPTYAFQWHLDNSTIDGATHATYVLPQNAIVGSVYSCQVTATNAAGTASEHPAGVTVVVKEHA